MNTKDLIDEALALTSEPMRSTLGMKCGWQSFASHNGVEVQVSIWGRWMLPDKTRAIFWQGSRRISRAVAEQLLEDKTMTIETLKNGAVVIDRRNYAVLAKTDSVQPFVTWAIDYEGNTYCGHYFDNLAQALADLEIRSGSPANAIV